MDNILPLDQLRALVAFADCGSCKAAAEVVFRSEAAVNIQLRKLEDNIGQPLFIKKGRRILLNDFGLDVVADARRILEICGNIRRKAAAVTMPHCLRIGAPDDFLSVLGDIITKVKTSFPDLTFDVVCLPSHQLRKILARGELDLALISCENGDKEGIALRRIPIIWAAARADYDVSQGPLHLAVFPEGCLMRKRAVQALKASGRDYHIAYTSSNIHSLQRLVQEGTSIAPFVELDLPKGVRALEGVLPPLEDLILRLKFAPGAHGKWHERLSEAIAAA